ncbi:MAG: hypothetical protein QOD25_2770 [Alphaproteobacteria bacterium]|nr:hypothetical protein [Alphaproteobacteria bacterium]
MWAHNGEAQAGYGPASRRPSSRCQTARFAASAAQPISFPRRIFCARVVVSLFFVSTASLRCMCRRFGRARARILGVGCSSGPEMRGRRSAGRRRPWFVAPVRRDLTLARRARPAQPGRPPLGAPPWRCPSPAASPAFAPDPGEGWLAGHRCWPTTDPGFDRGYEPRPTPHPAPPSGSSPETPLMSEDDNPVLYIRYVVKN